MYFPNNNINNNNNNDNKLEGLYSQQINIFRVNIRLPITAYVNRKSERDFTASLLPYGIRHFLNP